MPLNVALQRLAHATDSRASPLLQAFEMQSSGETILKRKRNFTALEVEDDSSSYRS
jgi:hypothetical protein